jgi:hypothetical protein
MEFYYSVVIISNISAFQVFLERESKGRKGRCFYIVYYDFDCTSGRNVETGVFLHKEAGYCCWPIVKYTKDARDHEARASNDTIPPYKSMSLIFHL